MHIKKSSENTWSNRLTLTEDERLQMLSTLNGLHVLDVRNVDHQILTNIELRSHALPERLSRLLIDFRKYGNEYGALYIRNIPIDDNLPETPDDGGFALIKHTYVSEYLLLEMMLHLGDPIAYADEKQGMLIQNICPVKGKEEFQENSGSVYLEFHTEDAFHPYKPDYVGLLCLRPDIEGVAATITASIRQALANVPLETRALLQQPLYRILLSSSFQASREKAVYSPYLPVLSGDKDDPELAADFYGMVASCDEGQKALRVLESALLDVAIEHRLCAGDLVILDNNCAAHARTDFVPHYDGKDRWLQRLFVVRDFQRSRQSRVTHSHVCAPLNVLSS